MHHCEFDDYNGIITFVYDLYDDIYKRVLPTFEQFEKYDIIKKFKIIKINCTFFKTPRIYINKKLRRCITDFPTISLYINTSYYLIHCDQIFNVNDLMDFIKRCYMQERIHTNILWTHNLHDFWPNKKNLNEKIITLLLISKKKHTSKHKYINCLVKGICMMIIKNMCMNEQIFNL